ncbi:MAG TPA: aromatic amino acid lyase, partial [Steroidobacteraceae bacterium]|nr:aromatic amino acid lyase [Steroidobacteraceae bacterium]
MSAAARRAGLSAGGLTLPALRRALAAPLSMPLSRADLVRVRRSRALIERLIARGKVAYGVNTGFGSLASERISAADLEQLQHNLVLSHAAGTGAPLSDAVVRLVLVLKIASLAQGYSGIRPQTLQALQSLLRTGVYPLIPSQGSVGASGDLAPLAHLSAVLLGFGNVRHRGRVMSARRGLGIAGLEPLRLGAKEGLALLNGTQVSTALALAGLFAIENV